MAKFSYLTTTHFDFCSRRLLTKEIQKNAMSRPLIVTDEGVKASGLLEKITDCIDPDIDVTVFDKTPSNPTEKAVLLALELYKSDGCDGIVSLGGGSPMDLGKAVALLANSDASLEEFDPMKKGAKRPGLVAPVIAVPTTAGTGSEVSIGFVIIMDDGRKLTFGSPKFLPRVAICDPELTYGMPASLTAGTGMDAITHCIETFLSPVVNPPADGIALDGLWRGWRNLPKAFANGMDHDARWQMMMASTEGALAFGKGLGAVHALSHAVGRLKDLNLHHGTLNAVFLPTVLRFNSVDNNEKYDRLRQVMGLDPSADLSEAVMEMNVSLGLPSGLKEMGIKEEILPGIVPFAVKDLAALSNPRNTTETDYFEMLKDAM